MARADITVSPRTRLAVIVAGVLFHLGLLLGLLHVFAPNVTAVVSDGLTAVLTVNITAPEPEPETPPEVIGEEGAAAPEGKKDEPKEVAAPEPKIRIAEKPAPKVPGIGDELDAGASDRGEGAGAGGEGQGTGAGDGGFGQGGGKVQKLEKVAGDINSTRDYPKAGRAAREGHSVTIQMTVGTDGRASNCRVVSPSPDPEADRITCRLAVERFRFRPRTDSRGVPVPGEYKWRQRWWNPRD
jgi:periplasmic protein TonB